MKKRRINGHLDGISDEGIDTGREVRMVINEDGSLSEFHTKHFQGCWMPAELLELFEEGTINAKEVLLLLLIGTMVRHGNSPKGCYASNAYLAKKVRVSHTRNVRQMLEKLKKLKLVRVVSFDGRHRYLETKFSRTGDNKKFKGNE